ncbi:hypothetical protein ASPZODRAFT_129619 [Penicilliopsis zonata CBS 506.65]|uniref:Mtf2-like C-terminal domain-containing protein n=1 Tax=Penicilliopsis zonata CBS 506.65 TaxID=1073090 RepID=A0A1L9SQ02_9EURO|nr:hypothetical protein ASPZODRAFT_129619 [Penicilliopsis zonata CBS 506.65]OJJ49206.1 hypothetical protein ASPZODRAFT_129619 [Penicilliopsis zonata CBS 506.65]
MSGRISRLTPEWAARNSLVPFLYQTRTLASPQGFFASKPRPFRPQQHLYFTSSRLSQQYASKPHDPQSSKHDVDEDESATEPSQSPEAVSRTSRVRRKTYLQRRAASLAQPETPTWISPKARTMTRAEKRIFGELLDQLDTGLPTKDAASISPNGSALSDRDRAEMTEISSIFDEVLKENRAHNYMESHNENDDLSDPTSKRALEDIAPEQQPKKWSDGPAEVSRLDQVPTSEAARSVVRREFSKIEAALNEAVRDGKGDIGIMEVCKERVFSMLQDIDHETTTAAAAPTASLPEPSAQEEGEEEGEEVIDSITEPKETGMEAKVRTTTSGLEVPWNVPVEMVVTALYPEILLAVLRSLTSNFPSSPLISEFLTTIKSYGRTSAVMGASTGLYNELIQFYWRSCADVPAVTSLLRDMEVMGVEPDEATCGLLHSIVARRRRDLHALRRWKFSWGSHPNTDAWWEIGPTKTAMEEIMGADGWLRRLQARVQDLEDNAEIDG